MFGHRVALRPIKQRAAQRGRPRIGVGPAMTDDERDEVYTDLATLLALADTEPLRPSA